ncbi:MAG TPA: hemin uptake protein HemP [Burkholderiales bacterium]|nr:hemin uptake protein HemP [Burkholderiales bacterium]
MMVKALSDSGRPTQPEPASRVDSRMLIRDRREPVIAHDGREYRLRPTPESSRAVGL